MKTKVYVILGSTGQFEDVMEWVVCVFSEETKANFYTQTLNTAAKNLYDAIERNNLDYGDVDFAGRSVNKLIRKEVRTLLKLDPRVAYDYTGVYYKFVEADLF